MFYTFVKKFENFDDHFLLPSSMALQMCPPLTKFIYFLILKNLLLLLEMERAILKEA